MEKNYWLHRIKHEWEVSYKLLEMGYLSLGWSVFSKTNILEAARSKDSNTDKFEKIFNEIRPGEKNRSRWSMWYFAQFNVGDYIIVPRFDGEFSVCEVIEIAKSIGDIKEEIGDFTDKNNNTITWEDGLLTRNNEKIDLGFVIKVKEVKHALKRKEYADSALTSRMKMRTTNGNISDLRDSVEEVVNSNKPINFYENVVDAGVDLLFERIKKDLNPDKFELLVEKYMQKIGANNTYIPSKNERGKKDYADADVIASFDALKITVQIQVKFHEDETPSWAVEQIIKYKEQLEDEHSELTHENNDDFTIIPWVISSCDDFDIEAKNKAKEENVRLVNGKDFSRMLMDVGLANLSI